VSFSAVIMFFTTSATTEYYPLSLHDALPIYMVIDVFDDGKAAGSVRVRLAADRMVPCYAVSPDGKRLVVYRNGRLVGYPLGAERSEEHTSELQSLAYLVCRLLLEKKKQRQYRRRPPHRSTIPRFDWHTVGPQAYTVIRRHAATRRRPRSLLSLQAPRHRQAAFMQF